MPMQGSLTRRKLNIHTCELPKTSESNLPKLPPNAKFYYRWKRSFQKVILVSVKHPLTRFFLRSHAAIAFEKRKHGRSAAWWVIHPCSDFRFCWDILMTFIYLYIFISVPYIISFYRIAKSAGHEYWDSVSPAFIVCLIDIVLSFITGYISTDGHEIFLDPVLIARNYLKGYFLIDLVSSIPYVWYYQGRILPSGPNSNSYLLLAEILPILKLLRIRTLRRYIRQINKIFRISHSREMTIWLAILTSLIFHWSACTTYAFPHIVMHMKGESMEKSLAFQIETELFKQSDWKIYLMCFHMGVSNLVGSGFIELTSLGILDKVIRCILLLLGKGYMIYLIVIILQLGVSSVEPELKYQQLMHQVREYARDKKLPKRLHDKLITYYRFRFQGSYFKEHAISNTLSNHLNEETILHSSRGLLETTAILHNLPRNVVGNLMAILKPVIYLEEDIIYKCDTEGDCMYFIASGTVALITFYGKEICHIHDGGYFGEGALIYPDRRRLESVIALEQCELLQFNRRDFKRLFPLKSEFYVRLEKVASERIERINDLNKHHNELSAKPFASNISSINNNKPETENTQNSAEDKTKNNNNAK